jgi:Tol biopolymer transport system component
VVATGYGDSSQRVEAGPVIAFTRDLIPASQIRTIRPDGSGDRQLTRGPSYALDPAWSPDGKRIAFVGSGVGTTTIYLMNADGSKRRNLLPRSASQAYFPAWSPRGDRIGFNGLVFLTRTGIYTIGTNGRRLKAIRTVRPSSLHGWVAVSFSPKGGTIAFTHSIYHRDTDKAYLELWLANTNGSHARKLVALGSTYGKVAPDDPNPTSAWSPDGKLLAVSVYTSPAERDIYIVNRDGSGFQNLTRTDGDDLRPSWSPDGTQIVFSTNRDGNYELYVMNADGSNETRLTNNHVADFAAAWQPAPK